VRKAEKEVVGKVRPLSGRKHDFTASLCGIKGPNEADGLWAYIIVSSLRLPIHNSQHSFPFNIPV
jgi:hypothetical protein